MKGYSVEQTFTVRELRKHLGTLDQDARVLGLDKDNDRSEKLCVDLQEGHQYFNEVGELVKPATNDKQVTISVQ